MTAMKIFKPTHKLTLAMLLAAGAMTLLLQGCNEEVPVTEMGAAGTTVMPLEDQDADIQALAIAGGRLYDHWMDETPGFDTANLSVNLLMRLAVDPALSFGEAAGIDTIVATYRCKNCHGWDYKGADGQYGLGSSKYTGFKGILGAAELSEDELIEFLTNGRKYVTTIGVPATTEHNFATYLTDEQIKQLAYFVKFGTLDTNPYIGRFSGIPTGDNAKGSALYAGAAKCESCHKDGTVLMPPGETIGGIANENPWELLHKIRFGQPKSNPIMPSLYNAGLTTQDAVDIMTHAQDLP